MPFHQLSPPELTHGLRSVRKIIDVAQLASVFIALRGSRSGNKKVMWVVNTPL